MIENIIVIYLDKLQDNFPRIHLGNGYTKDDTDAKILEVISAVHAGNNFGKLVRFDKDMKALNPAIADLSQSSDDTNDPVEKSITSEDSQTDVHEPPSKR